MEQTYRDLVDYVLCNDIENEELCNLSDMKYQKLINDIANDLLFDSKLNDYIDNTIEYYLKKRLKEKEENNNE